MAKLFSPFPLSSALVARNRIVLSPMCQYSAIDGVPNDWHHTHYVSRAVGGVGVIIAEATSVNAAGRISPADTGIWNAAQTAAWAPITAAVVKHGAIPGIQIAHAGRKASSYPPWSKPGGQIPLDAGGWETVAPSAIAFDAAEGERNPTALNREGLKQVVADFVAAAANALAAGFQLLEVHAAHGYLLHEFLSPLANSRTDEYGGSLENRLRFPLEVVAAVRAEWPASLPLWVRISATDWAEHTAPTTAGAAGWTVAEAVVLSAALKAAGVDLIDTSSGALIPGVAYPVSPGWQVPLAARIRAEAHIATGAVGVITGAAQAEDILQAGHADAVLLGRELLRNPYWPLQAALELGAAPTEALWPKQYLRGRPTTAGSAFSRG